MEHRFAGLLLAFLHDEDEQTQNMRIRCAEFFSLLCEVKCEWLEEIKNEKSECIKVGINLR